ncbi:envelope-like protein [Cucumis melo var. makuwa]|uniref:Envelope-like protein n=1 Tax=Cucumis melo var. makuwa TaxID=1194695 RepID=A0A5D3CR07_CUCMM|nr:envelope-like protein [Cucumis melo var. makuwa]TYK14293.1 envelope-like protein [Cucumis melo var. makuwa]
MGGNFDDPANQNPGDVNAHVELTNTCAPNNVEPNVNVKPQPETQQSPGEYRLKGKKFQQNRQNITTKASKKKIPPNIPFVPIDGISLHLENSVQRWKYVVQRRIADELLRHVGTFGVKIPIPLPHFFSSILTHLNVEILTPVDAPGPDRKTLSLNENAEGFFVHRDLASKIINSLIAESRVLSTSINMLSNRRLEVDSLVCHLKTLIPSSSTSAPD